METKMDPKLHNRLFQTRNKTPSLRAITVDKLQGQRTTQQCRKKVVKGWGEPITKMVSWNRWGSE
jgi:hypothetical protein